jgi:putative hydrolase of the HAD superfamily
VPADVRPRRRFVAIVKPAAVMGPGSTGPVPVPIAFTSAFRKRTNGRDAFQRSKIDGMGVTKLVDSIVTSGGFGVKKPDPRIFVACLNQLQVAPESAAFVGDDFAADMEPAIALGMLPVWKNAERSNRVAFASHELTPIGQRLLSRA